MDKKISINSADPANAMDPKINYRLIAVMANGDTFIKDFTWRPGMNLDFLSYFPTTEIVHRADIILAIDTDYGVTKVVKNRWGQRGIVMDFNS